VNFQVAGHQTEGYQVATEVYEGPLDLLLELIERAELDITRLALAQVTDQYLAYLQVLQERNAAEVSAFLVIAARLIQIKSAALLPRPTIDPSLVEEEDPGEALARQLILYKKFKEKAAFLDQRSNANLRTYLRLAPSPKVQGKLDLSGVSIHDLARAAWDIFVGQVTSEPLSKVVSMPRITIRDRIKTILDVIHEKGTTTFNTVLDNNRTRVEIVVTFLAMLELIKRRILEAQQSSIFGDITLQPIGEILDAHDVEVEFTE
jgi:segregation and condensation protein A